MNFMNENINIDVNEEELKKIANNIRIYSDDLTKIKEEADIEWNECSKFLDDASNTNIATIKDQNNQKFKKNIEELEGYANKLEFVSNVLKDTEQEIKASTKNFESLFEKINNNKFFEILNKNK